MAKSEEKSVPEPTVLDLTERQATMLEDAIRRAEQAKSTLDTVLATVLAGFDLEQAHVQGFDSNARTLSVIVREDLEE